MSDRKEGTARARRILAVDDDPAIQSLIETALVEEGFEVHLCANGANALQTFHETRPDLVLLDVMLPDKDGFQICREIRAEVGGDLPILFMTVQGNAFHRLRGFEVGGHDYMVKPFSIAEMIARVGVHLRVKGSRDLLTEKNYTLELRERLRRELTDMIVHDLKSPLSCIKGTLEIIQGCGMISPKADRWLKQSESMADMMLLMINDILDLGQAEHSGLPVDKGNVSLPAMFVQLRALFDITCRNKRIALGIRSVGRSSQVFTDQKLLFRILANLISNAVKFSPMDSRVSVVHFMRGRTACFAVSDRGHGIFGENRTEIFKKYVRAGDTGTTGGTGIGLAFCRMAVEALGGKIWAETREGGGSRFVLELARAEPR